MSPCAILSRMFLPVLVVLAVLAFAALALGNVAVEAIGRCGTRRGVRARKARPCYPKNGN